MRINETLTLSGDKCRLVPYQPWHVEKYHAWMQDPWLREMTGSEPLSLREEYDMQKSWREDKDKCTFIILDGDMDQHKQCGMLTMSPDDEIRAMAGDINMFFEGDGYETAELMVMTAREDSRRKGIAREACILMIWFAVDYLQTKQFVVKINESNEGSIQLFQSLGFKEQRRIEAFSEVHLTLDMDSVGSDGILGETSKGIMSVAGYTVKESDDQSSTRITLTYH
eukprot:gb/GECG01015751.1/.p1 GENE.gb/GECG01015751.1/~~gb/GECG01015751.1/.p1  ORF type:complete len:225 (+),score=31.73 gb/GECG01015751.1/:1-675(+)